MDGTSNKINFFEISFFQILFFKNAAQHSDLIGAELWKV
jgi:hypothetical protein